MHGHVHEGSLIRRFIQVGPAHSSIELGRPWLAFLKSDFSRWLLTGSI